MAAEGSSVRSLQYEFRLRTTLPRHYLGRNGEQEAKSDVEGDPCNPNIAGLSARRAQLRLNEEEDDRFLAEIRPPADFRGADLSSQTASIRFSRLLASSQCETVRLSSALLAPEAFRSLASSPSADSVTSLDLSSATVAVPSGSASSSGPSRAVESVLAQALASLPRLQRLSLDRLRAVESSSLHDEPPRDTGSKISRLRLLEAAGIPGSAMASLSLRGQKSVASDAAWAQMLRSAAGRGGASAEGPLTPAMSSSGSSSSSPGKGGFGTGTGFELGSSPRQAGSPHGAGSDHDDAIGAPGSGGGGGGDPSSSLPAGEHVLAPEEHIERLAKLARLVPSDREAEEMANGAADGSAIPYAAAPEGTQAVRWQELDLCDVSAQRTRDYGAVEAAATEAVSKFSPALERARKKDGRRRTAAEKDRARHLAASGKTESEAAKGGKGKSGKTAADKGKAKKAKKASKMKASEIQSPPDPPQPPVPVSEEDAAAAVAQAVATCDGASPPTDEDGFRTDGLTDLGLRMIGLLCPSLTRLSLRMCQPVAAEPCVGSDVPLAAPRESSWFSLALDLPTAAELVATARAQSLRATEAARARAGAKAKSKKKSGAGGGAGSSTKKKNGQKGAASTAGSGGDGPPARFGPGFAELLTHAECAVARVPWLAPLTDRGVSLLLEGRCRDTLLDLDLEGCAWVGKETMAAVGSRCSALQRIGLAGCTGVGDGALLAFCGGLCGGISASLRSIDLTRTEASASGVRALTGRLPGLRLLVMVGCDRVDPAEVVALARGLPDSVQVVWRPAGTAALAGGRALAGDASGGLQDAGGGTGGGVAGAVFAVPRSQFVPGFKAPASGERFEDTLQDHLRTQGKAGKSKKKKKA